MRTIVGAEFWILVFIFLLSLFNCVSGIESRISFLKRRVSFVEGGRSSNSLRGKIGFGSIRCFDGTDVCRFLLRTLICLFFKVYVCSVFLGFIVLFDIGVIEAWGLGCFVISRYNR